MVLAFLNYMDRNLLPPALDAIEKDLHLSGSQLGALSTGFFIVYAITAPLSGYLADRWRRKSILLFAVVSWSLITAVSGLATGFIMLLTFRALTGLGEGGYFPTSLSLIGDLFDPDQRGKAIGLHGACTTLGGSAGYALGGALVTAYGWRMPFFLAIVPGLVLSLVLWRFFAEPSRGQRETVPAPAPPPAQRRRYVDIATAGPVLLISLAAFAASFSMNSLNSFMPDFLQKVHHLNAKQAGVLTGVGFSATLVGQLGGGFSSDAFARRIVGARPLLVAGSYLLAAPAVLGIAYLASPTAAIVAYAVTQVGRGFGEPNLYGTIIDAVAPHECGTAQGFLLAMTFAGSSAGPWITGYLRDAAGFSHAFELLAVASAVASACALALFMRLRRP